MQTTIYKCDRCGEESTDRQEINLDRVGVFVGIYERRFSYGSPSVELIKEWCQNCREKYGLVQKVKESKVEVTPTTLEDMVREIVREELDANNN